MSCCSRDHNARRHYRHGGHQRPGVIRRVTKGLSRKFGVPRKLVIAGFIVGLIINAPLTILAFLIALYWVDHPGKLEGLLERAGEKLQGFWSSIGNGPGRPAYSGSAGRESGEEELDFSFGELRRQFDDLERRTNEMEAHVSSGEFHLNKAFKGMRGEGHRRD
ncbi:MAG: hypothetical protein Kow006_06220 [Gammaproteobacteria bacterium]